MRYEIRPLGAWREGDTPERRSSGAFRASWEDTLKLLGRELEHLDARQVVMQVDVREGDLRLDGMLRAHAKVGHPGVRIAFESKHGPLTYATDAYEQLWAGDLAGWKANVRAIALGLEALRAVDRYGVTRRGEQYTGWKQLGAGTATATPFAVSRADAITVIRNWQGEAGVAPADLVDAGSTPEALKRAFRIARGAAHPDRRAGADGGFLDLEQAGRALGLIT